MHNSMFQYDLAMYNRIHAMYPEVIFSSPEECFKVNAKQHGGKVLSGGCRILPSTLRCSMTLFSVQG